MESLSRPVDPRLALAVCPLCYKVAAFTTTADVSAGSGWRCVRCGQSWNSNRLDAVAAYVRHVVAD